MLANETPHSEWQIFIIGVFVFNTKLINIPSTEFIVSVTLGSILQSLGLGRTVNRLQITDN